MASGNEPHVVGGITIPSYNGDRAAAIVRHLIRRPRDVFDQAGNLAQAFTTTANQCEGFPGSNPLAFVSPPGIVTGCLVLADVSAPGCGNVDSFSLATDGTVVAEVSHARDPERHGTPEDVKAGPGGAAKMADGMPTVERSTVNADCTLGSHVVVSTRSTGLAANTTVAGGMVYAANEGDNSVDTYSLATMARIHVQPSGVSSATNGISVRGRVVAIGSETSTFQVQADRASVAPYQVAGDPTGAATMATGPARNCLFGANKRFAWYRAGPWRPLAGPPLRSTTFRSRSCLSPRFSDQSSYGQFGTAVSGNASRCAGARCTHAGTDVPA